MNASIVQQARAGAAFIISSHLLTVVEGLCTSVLIMERGRPLGIGKDRRWAPGSSWMKPRNESLEEVFFRLIDTPVPAGAAGARGPVRNTMSRALVLLTWLRTVASWRAFWRSGRGAPVAVLEVIGHALVRPLLGMACACAAVFAMFVVSAGAYFLFGQSIIAALAAAWLTLAAGGSGLVVLVSYVFDRFDGARVSA